MIAELHDCANGVMGPNAHLLVDDEGWADLKRRTVEFGAKGRSASMSTVVALSGLPVYRDECPCTATAPTEGASVAGP